MTSNMIIWDVITSPCLRYVPLAPKFLCIFGMRLMAIVAPCPTDLISMNPLPIGQCIGCRWYKRQAPITAIFVSYDWGDSCMEYSSSINYLPCSWTIIHNISSVHFTSHQRVRPLVPTLSYHHVQKWPARGGGGIAQYGPLTRYVKLRMRMRQECRERFPRHRG